MSVETMTQNALYTYPNAILGSIHRYRARALPEPIRPSFLRPISSSQDNTSGYSWRRALTLKLGGQVRLTLLEEDPERDAK
jgi:hypothetical protein